MAPPRDPDLDLLDRWRADDRRAGDTLLAKHFESLRLYFMGSFPDGHEDLLQETFRRVVESRDQFRGESTFKTYLLRIARYVGYEHIRRRYRQDEMFSPASSSLADLTGHHHSSLMAQQEDHRLLLDAIQHLVIEQQEVIVLYYWQKLSAREVAEVVEVPESTVRSRLRSAIARLAALHDELGRQGRAKQLDDDQIAQRLEELREIGRRALNQR